MKKLNNLNLKKRLIKAFSYVIALASAVIVSLLVISMIITNRYDYTLEYYAFPQGDVGEAMFTFSEILSSTRAVIGYDEQEYIDNMMGFHDGYVATLEEQLSKIEAVIVTDEDQAAYNELISLLDAYYAIEANVLSKGATTDLVACKEAQDIEYNELYPAYEKAYNAFEKILETNRKQGDAMANTLHILQLVAEILVIVSFVFVLWFTTRIAISIANGITKPVSELQERLKLLALGDFSSPFPHSDSKDEVADMVDTAAQMCERMSVIAGDITYLMGEMAERNFDVDTQIAEQYVGAFSAMLDAIQKMNRRISSALEGVSMASEHVSAGSVHLAEAAQELAEGSTEQAGAVDGMQSTIARINDGIQRTVKMADESYQSAEECATVAQKSGEDMVTLVDAMGRINETSNKIKNIIGDIESIATQTNLLSLNASIEAARAGEAGRGFAVVAEQIKQLAEQSAQSAVDTRVLIESSVNEIEEGNKLAAITAESLQGVVAKVNAIAELSKALNSVAVEQKNAIQIAEDEVAKVADIAQSNAATAEESSATSEELSAQSITLNDLVSKFTLKNQ